MNHSNFDFTQIPDKTNDMIFLKSPKSHALGPFLPDGIFSKKSSSVTQLYMDSYHYTKFQKKLMSQSQENLWADGRKVRQTVFYRTLPTETRGTTTSLQQLTAGNTPNLLLKTWLRYFLKIPPLKKILQFQD